MRKWLGWTALVIGVAALMFFALAPGIVENSMNKVVGPQPPPVSRRAAALHRKLFIADMHADTLLWSRDILKRGNRGQVDLPRLRDGNVALQVLSSVTKTPKGQNYNGNGADTDNITTLVFAQAPALAHARLADRTLALACRKASAGGGCVERAAPYRPLARRTRRLGRRPRG